MANHSRGTARTWHLDTDVEEERKWSKLFTYFCKKYLHVAFWTEKTISTLRPRPVYFLHMPQQTQWQRQLEHALEYAEPVYTACIGMSLERHAQAFTLNRLPVRQPCRIRWMGKEVYVSPKAHERTCFFQSNAITFAYLEMQGDHRIKKKKKDRFSKGLQK